MPPFAKAHLLKTRHFLLVTNTVWAVLGASATADVRLPALISDHMVLQQSTEAQIWGWADPGEVVEARLGSVSAKTVTLQDGRWSLRLPELQAGTSGDLLVRGKNSLVVRDVLVGEVWVCSGQSNMEWPVGKALNAQQEILSAQYPQIRHFTVARSAQAEPQEDCSGKWELCSPDTAARFTAVGYFFGRDLHREFKFPVGLLHSSWGGTPAEFWTPRTVLESIPEFSPIFEAWEKTRLNYPEAKAAYEKALEDWKVQSQTARLAGMPIPPELRPPRGGDALGSPGCLFHGMIAPLLPYSIQGVLWYQGESNAGRAAEYRQLFSTLIHSWRRAWQKEVPFLFVQLANYNARKVPPTGQPEASAWAELREAQLQTLEVPHTAMAVAIDIGEPDDIHPKNKQEVGRRLALAAQATVYFHDIPYSGPVLSEAQPEEGKIRLSFRHAAGLKAADSGPLRGFSVAGEDRVFHWAETQLEGDHLLVSSPAVRNPVSVRYNWADNPDGNLVNSAGLPASPFRTDVWPRETALKP
jgi:sialate O-acetylesterase